MNYSTPDCATSSCSSTQYENNAGQCIDCHTSCGSCYGGRSYECSSCAAGAYSLDGQCLSSCPSGYVGVNSTCVTCPSNCAVCNANGQCTQC